MVKVVAAGVKPRKKPKPRPKLTDQERHERFVAAAIEAKADESPGSFDRAFDKLRLKHNIG